jgi:PAS domain S-box-containing protein
VPVTDAHRVLLVEDNPGDARLIREMLREECGARCTVEHVDRLSAALDCLSRGGIDVVLLDLSLPDAQGFETFARAHAHAPTVPLVVLTGLDDEGLARHAVQEGAQDYLPKGEVTGHGLVRSLHYAIERARGEAERARLLAREQAARAEAEAERARVQAVLQSASQGIIFVDARTGHLTANPAAETIFGRPLVSEGGVQQYAEQVRLPDSQPVGVEGLPGIRALRGEPVVDEELLIVRPDGSRVPVLSSATPVREPAEGIIGSVVVHQDITVIKELERLREEWTSVIAHDLRQPVAAITAYAAALSTVTERQAGLEQVARRVGGIVAAAEQLDRMIGDLLDVSRIGAGRLTLERVPVDLSHLVHRVTDQLAEATSDRAIEVAVAGPLPPVPADPGRIEQVLGNLVSNAAKYGDPGTPVGVSVEQQGDGVRIAVTNRGKGIPPDEIPQLFTRFFRASAARSGSVPGLGLGLYICRELVQAHGGRIAVESVAGETTTFSFTLPLATLPLAAPHTTG